MNICRVHHGCKARQPTQPALHTRCGSGRADRAQTSCLYCACRRTYIHINNTCLNRFQTVLLAPFQAWRNRNPIWSEQLSFHLHISIKENLHANSRNLVCYMCSSARCPNFLINTSLRCDDTITIQPKIERRYDSNG